MSTSAVISQRNKRKFVHDNAHGYVHNNSNKDGTVRYWTCERESSCRAKIHASNDIIIKHVGDHTHGPNVDAVEANVLLNDMVHEAETTQHTTRNLIRSAVSNQDDSVLATLPSITTIARSQGFTEHVVVYTRVRQCQHLATESCFLACTR
jgi:hypothetical protein